MLHTNLGRAPLSEAAREALIAASGYVDVEYDLGDGARARGPGRAGRARAALPDAGDVMVVNNGAAALLLAVTVLAGGREVVWSRGELVEIGDGFRLPDLLPAPARRCARSGPPIAPREADYIAAIGERTGCMLKVHPSNFQMTGFTSAVPIGELGRARAAAGRRHRFGAARGRQPASDEPDIAGALRAGADLVTASGDKLLGGPQAGLIAGRADLVAGCGAIRSPAPCGSTSSRLRRSRRRSAVREHRPRSHSTPTPESCACAPRRLRAQLGDDARCRAEQRGRRRRQRPGVCCPAGR